MSTINPDWKLKDTSNGIRRHLMQPICQYSIDRLRVELKYAMNRLDELEKELNNEQ